MAKAEWTTAVAPKCRKIADQMGFELVDVCLDREPTGKYLRIYIDKPEGITLDDCEVFHKAVRPLVEDYDYDFMEVSSPGIDRPLKTERDFERSLGAEVEVRLFRPLEGRKNLTGILAGLEGEEILLEAEEGVLRIPRKAASLVKPLVNMEGIEDVVFDEEDGASPDGKDGQEESTQASE